MELRAAGPLADAGRARRISDVCSICSERRTVTVMLRGQVYSGSRGRKTTRDWSSPVHHYQDNYAQELTNLSEDVSVR